MKFYYFAAHMIRSFFPIAILLVYSQSLFAARVDTAVTYSASMKKNIKAVVVSPDSYSTVRQYPVIYLLHGYSGNYASFVRDMPLIKKFSDSLSLIFVCPDGNYNSWYFDSPIESSSKYETYVTDELVKWIDQKYSTIRDRRGRAITGLSMGGHGAFYLAFRHQNIFGAAGSMSGGVDIRPFPLKWDLASRLGSFATHPENWERNTVINLVYLLTPGNLALIFDCGTADFFYGVNLNLHQKLLERNIPHDFISRPGAHEINYWRNALPYQIMYFVNYFQNGK